MRQQKKTRVALIEYYLFNAKYGGWYKVQGQQLADCWVLEESEFVVGCTVKELAKGVQVQTVSFFFLPLVNRLLTEVLEEPRDMAKYPSQNID